MNERVVVEKLDRRRGIFRVLRLAADRDGRRETDERANPLAARPDRIAHRLRENSRTLVGNRVA